MVQAEKLTRYAESRPTAYSLRRQSTPTVFAEIEKRHGQQLALGGEKERCFSFGPSKPSFGAGKQWKNEKDNIKYCYIPSEQWSLYH